MRRQIVVIGLGRFGMALAKELHRRGHQVLGIDRSEQVVQEASESLTHAVAADSSDEATLVELGVGTFDLAIVALGQEVLGSILSTMALKRLGVPRVIARAQNDLHGEVLRRVGADKVVFPERDTGEQLAHSFFSANMLDYLDLGPDYGISKVEVPAQFVGRSSVDLELRSRFGLTLLAIQRGEDVIVLPRRDETFRAGDAMVLIGKDDQLDAMLNPPR